MEVHGLSGIRASQWLREFRDASLDWLSWDPKSKSHRATSSAYKAAKDTAAKDYASDLGLAAYLAETGVGVDLVTGNGQIAVAAWNFSRLSPETFARVRMAIASGTQLNLDYRSMRTPEPHKRTIEPHSLVQAGRRWHIRGYCVETGDFRDYVLGRIANVQTTLEKAKSSINDDFRWNKVVKVRIVAHPNLTVAQQAMVGSEYFNGTSARVLSCRAALVPYLIQELRLALDIEHDLPPEYQLCIDNMKEVKQWLFKG